MTGGVGFIGSHLARHLHSRGDFVSARSVCSKGWQRLLIDSDERFGGPICRVLASIKCGWKFGQKICYCFGS